MITNAYIMLILIAVVTPTLGFVFIKFREKEGEKFGIASLLIFLFLFVILLWIAKPLGEIRKEVDIITDGYIALILRACLAVCLPIVVLTVRSIILPSLAEKRLGGWRLLLFFLVWLLGVWGMDHWGEVMTTVLVVIGMMLGMTTTQVGKKELDKKKLFYLLYFSLWGGFIIIIGLLVRFIRG